MVQWYLLGVCRVWRTRLPPFIIAISLSPRDDDVQYRLLYGTPRPCPVFNSQTGRGALIGLVLVENCIY